MKITPKPSPNHSSREGHKPTMVVIHGDAGRTDEGTISWLDSKESQVSYHYMVGRDGIVYQFVQESENAWHAGVSNFHGEQVGNSVNRISIGVAFANDGSGHEDFRPVQYEVGGQLVADICRRHGIPLHRVRGHFEVSPGRKKDPWDWFDWDAFYRSFGRACRAIA